MSRKDFVKKYPNKTCLICSGSNPYTNAHNRHSVVDHDHATGFIRGWLCDLCNVWLGQYEAKRTPKSTNYKVWCVAYSEQIRRHLMRNTGIKMKRGVEQKKQVVPKPTPRSYPKSSDMRERILNGSYFAQ